MNTITFPTTDDLIVKEPLLLNETIIHGFIQRLVNKLSAISVIDDPSAEAARDAIKAAKDLLKTVESARKSVTAIFDARKKELIERERSLTAPLSYALEATRSALDSYLIEKRKAAELAQAQLAQNAQAAQAAIDNLFAAKASGADTAAAEQAAAEAIAKTTETSSLAAASLTKLSGLSTRTNWDYKVIDLSRVPRQFMTIDTKALKAHLQQQRRAGVSIESVIIPGIQVFETTSTIIR